MGTAKTAPPSSWPALKALLRADTIVQLHHRPSMLLSVLLPLCFLFNWKHLLSSIGPANVLAGCISLGLPSIGLMGYALVVGRDRELGVFQRLRTTPCPAWILMTSRFAVQMILMEVMAMITLLAAVYIDGIHTTAIDAARLLLAVLIVGPLFLSLGQMVVAVCIRSETVNSVTRIVYALVIGIGIAAQTLHQGNQWGDVLRWSPLGVAKSVISMAFSASTSRDGSMAILVAGVYTVVFTVIGVRYFRWNTS